MEYGNVQYGVTDVGMDEKQMPRNGS